MPNILCVGQAVQDFVFGVDEVPDRAEKFRADRFEAVGGGPAATAAVAITRLGGGASVAVRLGDDGVADLIVAELEGYGVDCRLMRRFAGCASSLSAVILDGKGERLIVNYLDKALPSDAGWLPDVLPEGTGAVLADTRWPDGAGAMLALAKAAGLPAVLDGDRPVPKDTDFLRAASHLAFSAEGLQDFSGSGDHEASLGRVADETGAWCCVTLGAGGVFYVSGEETGTVPAFPVVPVDTLGAGDVWHGAFTLALAEGQGEVNAVRFASAVAALKVQRFGARAGTPKRGEVETFLSEHSMAGDE
ncbi:MAG: PfkB family carbohydrate kinase [Sphingomonadales bacterium]|nr:PfkB family carbohydrate kinase [Sphingomonadales bacterium]